jgi:asparagine synthase (glutamine-hydrolysing)
MGDAIAHRGPDSSGIWVDAAAEVALAHRRLAIVDLSEGGHQPMSSHDGRYVIVFNGEIYNHAEMRAALEGEGAAPQWRGTSDTEVLLECAARWGLERTLAASVGMFAFALFDQKERQLILARDRLGEKPLYYGRAGKTFLFGSELKALAQHPAWTGDVDRDAVALFMRYGNVPAPHSIYCGIGKLEAGTSLTLDLGTGTTTIRRYWSAVEQARRGAAEPFAGSAEQATSQGEALLKAAISDQMIADVPLGAFLSGGVDSSTVVALMQSMSPRPVRTFTIGFDVEGYNEAEHAKAVARHLGTDHTELYCTERDALDVVGKLPEIYCEPFADASQIPTYLVSKLARQHVTVSLSGDGGDELFSGYTRHAVAHRIWPWLGQVPAFARRAFAQALIAIPPAAWDGAARLPLALLPQNRRPPRVGEKLHKASGVIGAASEDDLYAGLISQWPEPDAIVLGAQANSPPSLRDFGSLNRRMMLADLIGYLPDDVLVKVDRASMAVALESRVPMLDHRLIEYTLSLPDTMLHREGQSKWLLRQILYRYVPRELIERPKMGFSVPIDRWLRGELRDWAEDLLSPQSLNEDGILNTNAVRQAWSEHLSGHRNLQQQLWTVLMFQAWYRSLHT